jgi:DNA-binding MltR family transcriptional regulator
MTAPPPSFLGSDSIDWNELFTESDRGAVLISVAILEDELTELLRRTAYAKNPALNKELLAALFKPRGALSAFAAKIQTAYVFGFIGDTLYHELETIRTIRNKFAHGRHPSRLTSRLVAAHIAKLRFGIEPNKVIAQLHSAGLMAGPKFSAERNVFVFSVVSVVHYLRVLSGKTRPHGGLFDGTPEEQLAKVNLLLKELRNHIAPQENPS